MNQGDMHLSQRHVMDAWLRFSTSIKDIGVMIFTAYWLCRYPNWHFHSSSVLSTSPNIYSMVGNREALHFVVCRHYLRGKRRVNAVHLRHPRCTQDTLGQPIPPFQLVLPRCCLSDPSGLGGIPIEEVSIEVSFCAKQLTPAWSEYPSKFSLFIPCLFPFRDYSFATG